MAVGDYARIYNIVKRIPRGRVATYGQIAQLAGLGKHARQVGYTLSATHDALNIPWHRVINARGEISARPVPDHDGEKAQRRLLEREGIECDAHRRISLSRYQWRPRSVGVS